MVTRLFFWLADQFSTALLLASIATAGAPSCARPVFAHEPPKSDAQRTREVKVALAVHSTAAPAAPAIAPMPHEVKRAKKIDDLLGSDRKKKVEKILFVVPCDCPDGGKCTCPPGKCDCPGCGCNATGSCKSVASKRDYANACERVAKGERVTLCVGDCTAVDLHNRVESLPGFASGVYDCFQDARGVAVMQLRDAAASTTCVGGKCYSNVTPASYATPARSNPFTVTRSSCPNGQCPNAR